MIRKAGIFALVVSLCLVLSSPGLVQAGGRLAVVDSSVVADFPANLRFNLSAESDVNITDIRLHYSVSQESFSQVINEVYIDFIPGTNVNVGWTWDMRKTGGLPTGSIVEYWWTVEDVGGNKAATTPVRVGFNDNRYSWQSLKEGEVTIYWYEGDKPFAQELMSAAKQALARLLADTGSSLKKPVKIYIYANSQDLQGAMIFPPEWAGGVTLARYGVIAIGIAPNNLAWGKRAMAHELTHLVIHQMTFNPYTGLPVWLDEGLAMYTEGILDVGFSTLLSRAVAENSLISVRSLSSPFSAYSEESILSYAQSYSLVQFLISNYGQEKMLGLLNTLRAGSSYDRALSKVYGFDMDGLNTLWQGYVTQQYQQAGVKTTVMSPSLTGTLAELANGLIRDLGLVIPGWVLRWDW